MLAEWRRWPRVHCWILAAEEFEEGSGEERVGEFEGVAAGAAQPVRLLQSLRNPLLLAHFWQRDRTFPKNRRVQPFHDGPPGHPGKLGGNQVTIECVAEVTWKYASRVDAHPEKV